MKETVVIMGSSRPNGNTFIVSKQYAEKHNTTLIDLNDYQISYYDYNHKNKNDDFLPLIKNIIEKYNTLIFSTPVYWYNMSGIMKVFFDRISDLLTIEKELGRQLRGKNMMVLSNSSAKEIEDTFYIPFKRTSDYLGMKYLGQQHFSIHIP